MMCSVRAPAAGAAARCSRTWSRVCVLSSSDAPPASAAQDWLEALRLVLSRLLHCRCWLLQLVLHGRSHSGCLLLSCAAGCCYCFGSWSMAGLAG